MIVTTGFEVPGYEVESVLGVVRGIVVRSPGIAQGLMGGLRQIFGGNIIEYVQVSEKARSDAYEIMIQHAMSLQADAIIGMRYDATEFAPSITEVLAYGTAVRLTASEHT
ncbi:YbjQ family protein [bacterium]|nr:YbjQ family protein [bacterium]